MKERWKEETLIDVIKKSNSINDALVKLGLRAAGENNKTLRKFIDLYNIDTSHFKKNWETIAKISRNKKIPTNDLLVENSNYNRGHLKERLYSEGLKKRICELCGQNEMWNGKKMSLILDHKNGIHNDNRLENLRIVCPNCNGTLSTHCGKNLRNKKINFPKPESHMIINERLKEKTKFEIIREYGESLKIKRIIKEIEILDNLKNSDIDFNKFGWVSKASKIIGVKDQVVNRWLKRIDPEFYSKCFKKKG
jgi:hypothetical protein